MTKSMRGAACSLIALMLISTGCEDSGGSSRTQQEEVGDNNLNTVVALGDSMTVGPGVSSLETYPAQLAALTGKRVINAGVSGERSDQGLDRASRLLKAYKPAFLIIFLGTNDAIQGTSLTRMEDSLRTIVRIAKGNNTIPILTTVPRTYGSRTFALGALQEASVRIRRLAREEGIDLVDIESAFGDNRSYLLDDGLHPSVKGHALIAARMEPRVQ